MSILDIIGPVMIGPSSSHTAGAVRLGLLATSILGSKPVKAEIYLHGSFAETYKGHGTDMALLAGLMGWLPDDERIPQADSYAEKNGLEYSYHKIDNQTLQNWNIPYSLNIHKMCWLYLSQHFVHCYFPTYRLKI